MAMEQFPWRSYCAQQRHAERREQAMWYSVLVLSLRVVACRCGPVACRCVSLSVRCGSLSVVAVR